MANKQYITKEFSDVDFWLNEWLKSNQRSSEHTKIAYENDIRSFLKRRGKTFNEIELMDIHEYQRDLNDGRLALRTQARKLASIRSFYNFLNRNQITSLNLDQVERVKIQRSIDKNKFLTEKEIEALIEAAQTDKQTHIFVRFLYLSAARISEALSLRWRDCNESDGGGQIHIIGKGKKPRDIFLPDPLWSELRSLRGDSVDSAYIFPSLDPHKAWEIIKRLAKAAKIEKNVTPHSFRHAHLSHALKHGASLAELRDQAGHADISTTSLYLHADKERATATRLKVK